MQLDLIPRPKGEDSPSTKFLCDVIRKQMGRLTTNEMRQRWKAGEYAGVNPAWAAWNMEL